MSYEQRPSYEKEESADQIGMESVDHDKKRAVAIPGEIIKTGKEYLPGDGTMRQGENIVACRFGLADEYNRFIRVIPLSGVYIPRRGNLVIGKVTDITFNGWIIDVGSPYSSFLMLNEYPKYIESDDLDSYIAIGDLVLCKILRTKRKGLDLTMKSRGLGKIDDGMIIQINSNKVPRVIGKEGSMINLIKDSTKCDITVGQNGIIWIKGASVTEELKAKDVINFIVEKSFLPGLTDEVKKYLEGKK
jgi:exosome complex component RRP4